MGKSGGGLLDRSLVPRIQQYALNRDINDLDALVDHLRRSYKEYQRRQIGALRQMVLRAVQILQHKSPSKPELALQVGMPCGARRRRVRPATARDGSHAGAAAWRRTTHVASFARAAHTPAPHTTHTPRSGTTSGGRGGKGCQARRRERWRRRRREQRRRNERR